MLSFLLLSDRANKEGNTSNMACFEVSKCIHSLPGPVLRFFSPTRGLLLPSPLPPAVEFMYLPMRESGQRVTYVVRSRLGSDAALERGWHIDNFMSFQANLLAATFESQKHVEAHCWVNVDVSEAAWRKKQQQREIRDAAKGWKKSSGIYGVLVVLVVLLLAQIHEENTSTKRRRCTLARCESG